MPRRRSGVHHHWTDWVGGAIWYFSIFLPLSTLGHLAAAHLAASKNDTLKHLGEALAYQVH